MNILLWVLQIFLALHTAMGAVWKFTNSEQTVSSLSAIPHNVWLSLSIFELLCSLCLILPVFKKGLAILIPIGAIGIALEMLVFCGVHISSGEPDYCPMIYWLVVAGVCAFVAFGRLMLKPISR